MNTFTSLLEKIERAEQLDFGDILSHTLELFKKTWLKGFLLILIIFVIAIPFIVAVYMPMYTALVEQIQNGDYNPNDPNSLLQFQTNEYRYMLSGMTFVFSFLMTAFVAGFYNIIKGIDTGEENKSANFFYFFKGKYLGRIFAIACFSLLISMLGFAFQKFLPPTIASVLSIILSMGFSVYSALFIVFFAFNPSLKSAEIFSLSFNLGTRKWMFIFGLLVITAIIGCLGAIACGFGMLFTMSIGYIPVYLIYREVIGFDTISDIDKIGLNDDSY